MNKCFFGDCREVLEKLINDGIKVQTCVTSPPYFGLRDYGHSGQLGIESTIEEYVENMVDVFRYVRQILEEDGTLWLNLGDSYGLKKNIIGVPWRVAFALQSDGWILRQDIIWSKPNPMPESVKDRCTKSHEYIFLLTKSEKYFYDSDSISEPSECAGDPRSGYGRLHYRGKREGNDGTGQENFVHITEKRNKRSVWTVNVKPYSGAHFATYPEELIEPCILAGSKNGDIVLDPFFGSGTTGKVAQNLGRKWIGCEINCDYEELQKQRTEQQAIMFQCI